MESYFEKLNLKYKAIKERLMDEESVKIFDARVEYTLSGDRERLEDVFFDKTKKWYCKELESFLQKFSNEKKIILFGAGLLGKKTKLYLDVCGYKPICYCDNNLSLKNVDGIPVISVKELVTDFSESIVIICSYNYGQEMYQQLISKGYDVENILLPGANRLQI